MQSERQEGIFTCYGMKEKIPDDVASPFGDFIAYLAQNGVVEPHIECHNVKTNLTNDDNDQATGCALIIDNVEPCAFKVMKRAANINPEFDNLGELIGAGR